jgi:hypothetical protein
MTQVYEIANIQRFNGNISHDFKRMGRLCTIEVLEEGSSAVLPYVLNDNSSLVTAAVENVNRSEDEIEFTTKHSKYVLRNVSHIITVIK